MIYDGGITCRLVEETCEIAFLLQNRAHRLLLNRYRCNPYLNMSVKVCISEDSEMKTQRKWSVYNISR